MGIESSEKAAEMEASKSADEQGGKVAPRSLVDIRAAREGRAAEAMKMKDEQIRILTEQNGKLLESIDHAEQEINALQLEKLTIEEENRSLHEKNFEVQSKAQAADGQLEEIRTESSDREKELKIMTAQNTELLRLLEAEEGNNANLAAECEVSRSEARDLKGKYEALINTSKSYEELANKSVREGQLQAEEVRLLRAEVEHLKQQSNEMSMKTTVEIESLQEQLRVRKEKQYQLLEKLQQQEEARRQAEDQVSCMDDRIRELRTKTSETETQLQLEINSKLSQEDANRKLVFDTQALSDENKELTSKWEKSEQERLRLEAEARDSGEQLREMAEKVFQLLERLKLAELGKTRSMEALRTKEQEVHALKKKNTRLINESTKEGKARVKAELDKKVLEDQIRALKKHNAQLGQRCKEEAKLKIREEEERKEAEEKVRTLNGRLSFLLNKVQTDEEEKVVQREDTKKMEGQLQNLAERCETLQKDLDSSEDRNRNLAQKIDLKDEEVQATKIKLEALEQLVNEQEESKEGKENQHLASKGCQQDRPLAGGRLRFFVESKPTLGMVLIKGKCVKDREWLDTTGCNGFLRKALKSQNTQEMLIQKLAELYGSAITQEEDREKIENELKERDEEVERLDKKVDYMHCKLSTEEESKRRTLLRYVNAVKASVSLGEPGSEKDREEVGRVGAGKIRLPEANLTDEEVHAVASTLQNNQSIAELNLRGNFITDEGSRAIAALLSGPSTLRNVDLRGNRISRNGVKILASALERSRRVKHVYVHAGGKIEALGTNDLEGIRSSEEAADDAIPLVSVDTVCVVDLRENNPKHPDPLGVKQELVMSSLDKLPTQGNGPTKAFDVGGLASPCKAQTEKATKRQNSKGRKKTDTKKRNEMIKEALQREKGWRGRAGGLDLGKTRSHSQSPPQKLKQKHGDHVTDDLPPVRPSSAESFQREKAKQKNEDSLHSSRPQISPFLQQMTTQKR